MRIHLVRLVLLQTIALLVCRGVQCRIDGKSHADRRGGEECANAINYYYASGG
jgi:hypothetical protein